MKSKLLFLFLITAALVFVGAAFHHFSLPDGYGYAINDSMIGIDWRTAFQPASRALLEGRSPYTVPGFYSPPWTLIPLIPLSLLSAGLSTSILFVANLAGWMYISRRIGVNRWLFIPFFFMSGAIANAVYGNLDGLIAVGLILPPWVGIPILMIKPQVGIPVTAFWIGVILFDRADIRSKATRLVKALLPFAVLLGISIALYGNWFMHSQDVIGKVWNTSPWPRTILLGIWLIWQGIRSRDIRFAVTAIPFLSPYISPYTWAFMTMALLSFLSPHFEKKIVLAGMRTNTDPLDAV
jgi:hypothetical protein